MKACMRLHISITVEGDEMHKLRQYQTETPTIGIGEEYKGDERPCASVKLIDCNVTRSMGCAGANESPPQHSASHLVHYRLGFCQRKL